MYNILFHTHKLKRYFRRHLQSCNVSHPYKQVRQDVSRPSE